MRNWNAFIQVVQVWNNRTLLKVAHVLPILNYAAFKYISTVFPWTGNTPHSQLSYGTWDQTQGLGHARYPSRLPIALIKHWSKPTWGREQRVYLFGLYFQVTIHYWEKSADAEEDSREHWDSLAYAHHTYTTQTHLPRDGATHNGLSLPSHFTWSRQSLTDIASDLSDLQLLN